MVWSSPCGFQEGTYQREHFKGSRGEAAGFLDLPMSLVKQVTEAQIQREGVRRHLDASSRLRKRAGMKNVCLWRPIAAVPLGSLPREGAFFWFAHDCHSDQEKARWWWRLRLPSGSPRSDGRGTAHALAVLYVVVVVV